MELAKSQDEHFMRLALDQARMAAACDEVPVGAALIDDQARVIAVAYNQNIGSCDPTAHAEILALRKACLRLKNYRLLSTTLYVTIEPCVMCLGAIIHARIERVVFGACDPKWGAAVSLYRLAEDGRFNHRPEVVGGVLENPCRQLIQDFFRAKRARVKEQPPGAGRN